MTKKPQDSALAELLAEAIESGDPQLIKVARNAIAKSKTKVKGKPGRPKKAVTDSIEVNPAKKKSRVGFDGNAFNPDDYANEFRNDTEWAKKLTPFKVSERRPEVNYVDMKCSRCAKVDSIPSTSPIFSSDSRYYVCNKCGATR